MRTTIIAVAFILSYAFAFADDLPYDVTQVVTERERQVAKIDEKYSAALERLKVSYTKKGDLETALKIDTLIKATASGDVVGEWSFAPPAGPRKYVFYADGTMTGHWSGPYAATFNGKWTKKLSIVSLVVDGKEPGKLELSAIGLSKLTEPGSNIVMFGSKKD